MGLGIFALLILTVDAVFITAHRGSRTAEVAADVNQNARIAIERLAREMRESGASGADIDRGDRAVVFRSGRPAADGSVFCVNVRTHGELLHSKPNVCWYYGASGDWASHTHPFNTSQVKEYAPLWQRFVGYYLDDDDERSLIRYAGDLASPTAALPSARPASRPTGSAVIATSVDAFTVSEPDAQGAVRVTLTALGTEVVQGFEVPPQQIVLEVTVLLRNTIP